MHMATLGAVININSAESFQKQALRCANEQPVSHISLENTGASLLFALYAELID
jgi:hypothetical protein